MASNAETVDHDCVERMEELSVDGETGSRKYEFATKTSKTDLVFVLGDKRLYVSSVVIEMCSPVFEKMISEKVKNEQGLIMEIEILGCSAEDFNDFLACFYPGKHHEFSDSSVFRILPLAHRYDVKVALQLCERQLLYMINRDTTSMEIFSECISMAYSCNLEIVKQQAFEIFKAIQESDFKELCIPLPKNHEAKAAILEACLPEFILTQKKYAFLLGLVPKLTYLDMSDFANACYSTLELKVGYSGAVIFPTEGNTIELGGLVFKFEIETKHSCMALDLRLALVEKHSAATDTSTTMAVLYRLHNLSNFNEDIILLKQFKGLDKVAEKSNRNIDSKMLEHIKSEFLIDGYFSMTIRVLMNKPGGQE